MGRHSGYDRVFAQLEERWPEHVTSVYRTRSGLQNTFYRPLAWLTRSQTPWYNGDSVAAELRALRTAKHERVALVHIAYMENNLRLFSTRRPSDLSCVVGTAHQSAKWWRDRHRHPELLSRLDAVIVLCQAQRSYFERQLPGRVHLIPHGVDLDFFSPGPRNESTQGIARCLFAGVWMRDLPTLRWVIEKLMARQKNIHIDRVVPVERREHVEFSRIARHDRVSWHAGLSDRALRDVYRHARLILLPLLDSTANNALLEGIACGLPVVITDVGGVRDYTDESFATRLPPGDVDGLVEAVLELAQDEANARRRGVLARAFAEQHFDWTTAAHHTADVYHSVLERTASRASQ